MSAASWQHQKQFCISCRAECCAKAREFESDFGIVSIWWGKAADEPTRQCLDFEVSERGCARSVSRSACEMLRLVFNTAALHQITTPPPAREDARPTGKIKLIQHQ